MIAVKYAPARLLKTSPLRVTNVAWNWLFSSIPSLKAS